MLLLASALSHSWARVISLALLSAVCYRLTLVLYSVYFGPLSKFPGPSLAAATGLYEWYHLAVKDHWYENLEHLHQKYGSVVRIGPNELHFNDADFNLRLHRRPDLKKCPDYYGSLNHIMGGMSDPRDHAARKSLIQPLFTGKRLSGFSDTTLNTHISSLHGRLLETTASQPCQPVNMTHHLLAFTTDVMFAYLTDESPDFLQMKSLQEAHDETRAFGAISLVTVLRSFPMAKLAFDLMPQLRSWSPLGWIDKVKSSATQDSATVAKLNKLQRIQWHLEPTKLEKQSKNSVHEPNVVAELWDRIPKERLVVHEAAQAIFIGNESLLSNMSCILHHMMKSGECIGKLRAELDTLNTQRYGHEIWRDPKVLDLPYLDALCRESTRMSAPGWHRQPRRMDEPLNYGNLTIPPKTSVSFTVCMQEQSASHWREPKTFRPDRWLGTDQEAIEARKNSVVFGTGTRTCLGQHIARHLMRKTLACLVYNFDVELWDRMQDEAEGYRYLNTFPKKGTEGHMFVRLRSRFASTEA